ncbi:unnamed protein product, partial [Aureobasidium pullulans]
HIIAGLSRPVGLYSSLCMATGHGAIILCSKGDVPLFASYHNTAFALLSNTMSWSILWCMSTLDRAMLLEGVSGDHSRDTLSIMRSITMVSCIALILSFFYRGYVGFVIVVAVSMVNVITSLLISSS